jgi:DNA anti-recombination protein RmuC
VGHFEKARTLARVAQRLEEGLALDREEVRTTGYSAALHSKEFAAVIEEIFGELYACLDTMRQVLKAVYPN